MKKALLSIFVCTFLGTQAQIFINTNPTPKSNTTTTTTKETTPVKEQTPTKQEVEVTSSKQETLPEPVKEVQKAPETKPVTTTTTKSVTPPASTPPAKTTTTSTKTTKSAPVTQPKPVAESKVAAEDEDVPPFAEPGKCYARCWVEDKYDYVNETVVDQPKTITKVKLPALYKTVYDTVVVTPATTKKYTVPAEYEYVKEEVMVTPATTKWIKGKADAGCLSANPEDCQVMCLVEVPAVYKTIQKKVLKNQAYEVEETIPMEYRIETRKVVVEEEKLVDEVKPATYKTVQNRVLVEKGGYQVWREILCGDDLTSDKITQIQKALKANGYNPGPIDDVFGPQTKAALMQYQKDKGLPVGNLNFETLRSLGVE